jgi:hypothetical protein
LPGPLRRTRFLAPSALVRLLLGRGVRGRGPLLARAPDRVGAAFPALNGGETFPSPVNFNKLMPGTIDCAPRPISVALAWSRRLRAGGRNQWTCRASRQGCRETGTRRTQPSGFGGVDFAGGALASSAFVRAFAFGVGVDSRRWRRGVGFPWHRGFS